MVPGFDVRILWYRVLMSYRSYRRALYRVLFYRTFRSVRYRYRCCTDTGTNSGADVYTGTGGTGIDVVPNLPSRTELTEVSGTDNTGGIFRRYASVRTVPNTPLQTSALSSTASEARSINLERQGHRSGRSPRPDGPEHRVDRPRSLKRNQGHSKPSFSSLFTS